MGAFVGRYANRISNGCIPLAGVVYTLTLNDVSTVPAAPRRNTLHGGKRGSRFIPFAAVQRSPRSVPMSIRFRDGEEGFPGDLMVRVVYALMDDDDLV